MTRHRFPLGLLFVLALSAAAPARAQIEAQSLVQNLAYPIAVSQAPGDPDRLFIVSQLGTIDILDDVSLLPTPFLDLSGEILFGAEQGLLGMTFDPDYASNGEFFVFFTRGTGNGISVVRRYTVSANPDSADPASGLTILEIPQLGVGHKGGTITFGPDGYLWLAPGDSNAHSLAQDPTVLLGKMLRIDAHGDDFPADSVRNYAIPSDNPFVSDPGTLDEIRDLGLRNPWRFSFDQLTGDLWIGDVGQLTWEEINFEPAGGGGGRNYGWPLMEGAACFNPPTDCNDGSLALPVHVWMHTTCNAAAGGYVYRGSELPAYLYGHYFFADYCLPAIWSFRHDAGSVTQLTDWSTALDVGGTLKFPASFWQDEDGELYVVEYRASLGEVWKIVPDPTYVGVEPHAGPRITTLLGPASPNPFTSATSFEVRPAGPGLLHVGLYSAAGRLVRTLHAGAAEGTEKLRFEWRGRDEGGRPLPSGVYFVRVESEGRDAAQRVVLLR